MTGTRGWAVMIGLGITGCTAPADGAPLEASALAATTSRGVLSPSDVGTRSEFGAALAIDGTRLLVGSPDATSGAAYIFEKSGDTWIEDAILTPTPGADDNGFGVELSLSGDFAVIANAENDVYVFQRIAAGQWDEVEALEFSGFGSDPVGLSGDTFVWGQPGPPDEADIYVRDGSDGSWDLDDTLFDPDAGNRHDFGATEVAFDGTRMVVGAQLATGGGAVYVYELDAASWTRTHTITAGTPPANVNVLGFGHALALRGDRLLVGATERIDSVNDAGAAYVFDFDGSDWNQTQRLRPADDGGELHFADKVALGDDWALLAHGQDSTAYVFEFDGTWTEADEINVATFADGIPVAIDGRDALIGDPAYDDGDGGVHVHALDDITPPTVDTNADLAVDEGSSATITDTHLDSSDNELAAANLSYTLTTAPTVGDVTRSGTPLGTNDSFTQDDIDNGRIAYVQDGTPTTSDTFAFDVSDGNNATSDTFDIVITLTNDAPVIGGDLTVDVTEGASAALALGDLTATDEETSDATTLILTLTTPPTSGTLTRDGTALANGDTFTVGDVGNTQIAYTHTGSDTTNDGFAVTASDGTATSSASTVTIQVHDRDGGGSGTDDDGEDTGDTGDDGGNGGKSGCGRSSHTGPLIAGPWCVLLLVGRRGRRRPRL